MNAETVAATVSPTGHQALQRIAATGPVGARTDSIHAATRSALDGRGLIVYTADGRGRPGGLVWLTRLGSDVLAALDGGLTGG
jgi:hypothetical protein